MMLMKARTFGPAVVAIGLLFMQQQALAAPAIVKVTLSDTTADINTKLRLGLGMKGDMATGTMSLSAKPAQVAAGVVTFQVTNASKATIHEMLVKAVSDTVTPIPFNDNENRAVEDKALALGEVSELDATKSGNLTITMKPGIYLLYCNVPGHYMSGMWTTIVVK